MSDPSTAGGVMEMVDLESWLDASVPCTAHFEHDCDENAVWLVTAKCGDTPEEWCEPARVKYLEGEIAPFPGMYTTCANCGQPTIVCWEITAL